MEEPERSTVSTEPAEQPLKDEEDSAQSQKYESLYERHKENLYFRWGLTAIVVVVVCVMASQLITKLPVFYAAVLAAVKTLSAVLYGVGIAYVLDPIVKLVRRLLEPRLRKVFKTPGRAGIVARWTGIGIAVVILILVVWALLAMILPDLIESISTIAENLPDYYNTIKDWVLARIHDLEVADYTEELMQSIYDYASNYLTNTAMPKLQALMENLTSSVVDMLRGALNILIGVIVSVYLLAEKERFLAQSRKVCYAVLGEKKGGTFCNVCTYANSIFGSFIGGKLVDSAIIGVLCFLGMTLLKLPYALLISVIVGCTNIIPVFGPFLGAIPSALLLLVNEPVDAVIFVIFILVLQQIDGNIIGPLILGDATGLGSFWVVVAILIFGGIWGIFGMIIGVPLFAVFYKIITEVTNSALKKRGLSTETKDYWDGSYPARKNTEKWSPVSRRQKRKHRRQLRRELRALQKLDRLHLLHLNAEDAEGTKDTENPEKTDDAAAEKADETSGQQAATAAVQNPEENTQKTDAAAAQEPATEPAESLEQDAAAQHEEPEA